VAAQSQALLPEVEDGSDYQTQRLPSCTLFVGSLLTQLRRYWIGTILMQQLTSRELVAARFFVRLEFLQCSLPVIHFGRYERVFLAMICDSICQQMLRNIADLVPLSDSKSVSDWTAGDDGTGMNGSSSPSKGWETPICSTCSPACQDLARLC